MLTFANKSQAEVAAEGVLMPLVLHTPSTGQTASMAKKLKD